MFLQCFLHKNSLWNVCEKAEQVSGNKEDVCYRSYTEFNSEQILVNNIKHTKRIKYIYNKKNNLETVTLICVKIRFMNKNISTVY